MISKVLYRTTAVGGAEFMMDAGSVETDVIHGSFNEVSQTVIFNITITTIPAVATPAPI